MAGRPRDSNSERNRECDANLNSHDSHDESFDSNVFVSLMNRLDPILKAFYSLSFIFCTAVNLATRLKDSILKALHYLLIREEAHGFFEAFHKLIAFLISILAASIGFHFQGLGVSPLETHFVTFLVLIMAAIVYSISYMGIKLQPQGADYLLLFRLICLVSGITAIELLISVMISPFWLFVVNFLPILIVGVLCSYKQIYQFLYYTADLISGAFQAFFSREREDNDNQRPGNV